MVKQRSKKFESFGQMLTPLFSTVLCSESRVELYTDIVPPLKSLLLKKSFEKLYSKRSRAMLCFPSFSSKISSVKLTFIILE